MSITFIAHLCIIEIILHLIIHHLAIHNFNLLFKHELDIIIPLLSISQLHTTVGVILHVIAHYQTEIFKTRIIFYLLFLLTVTSANFICSSAFLPALSAQPELYGMDGTPGSADRSSAASTPAPYAGHGVPAGDYGTSYSTV